MDFAKHFTLGQDWVRLAANFPVRQERLQVAEDVGPHDHDFTEICLVLSGEALHCTVAGEARVRPGDVLVIPPGPVHAFERVHEFSVINVYYLAEWFLWDLSPLWRNEGLIPLFFAENLFARREQRLIHSFALSPAELEPCLGELEDIQSEYALDQPSLLLVRGAFSKLLVRLARAWGNAQPELKDFGFRAEVWTVLEAIDAVVKTGETMRVEDLARRAHVSSDALYRAFKTATGLSLSTYHQQRRIQHASHLLLHSTLNIGQIAHQLGFADTSHLTRSFTALHGESPRSFRRKFGAGL